MKKLSALIICVFIFAGSIFAQNANGFPGILLGNWRQLTDSSSGMIIDDSASYVSMIRISQFATVTDTMDDPFSPWRKDSFKAVQIIEKVKNQEYELLVLSEDGSGIVPNGYFVRFTVYINTLPPAFVDDWGATVVSNLESRLGNRPFFLLVIHSITDANPYHGDITGAFATDLSSLEGDAGYRQRSKSLSLIGVHGNN